MNKTISDIAAAVSWIRNYHHRNINITEGLARIVLNHGLLYPGLVVKHADYNVGAAAIVRHGSEG